MLLLALLPLLAGLVGGAGIWASWPALREGWRARFAQVAALPDFATGPPPAQELDDPSLRLLRKATARWSLRSGPQRRVVDVVVLVPDLHSFFEAIARWDDRQYFPILLDEPETVLAFLRAFQPERIVRWQAPADAATAGPGGEGPEAQWARATAAVGAAWVHPERAQAPPGDRRPTVLPVATPPGLVVSEPGSPQLAGAVALAAGRFQPLVRWHLDGPVETVLDAHEARQAAQSLHDLATAVMGPSVDSLGDDGDFLTLAGPWPYRYHRRDDPASGVYSLDDRLGFSADVGHRWAYTGRLMGTAPQSVYQAMCGLFLTQPKRAALFSAYGRGEPWDLYTPELAADRLEAAGIACRVAQEPQADLQAWRQLFFGPDQPPEPLILINSSGTATTFSLGRGQTGTTGDVPPTDPALVLMIHSGSATNPYDPRTIAGRWLQNGAFAYFGAVNEPFLNAFRSPELVASLLLRQVPLAAALQRYEAEAFGQPWRLILVGDPLWRLERADALSGPPRRQSAAALAPLPGARWLPNRSSPGASPAATARDAFDALEEQVLLAFARPTLAAGRLTKLADSLVALPRDSLDPPRRLRRDGLLAGLLWRIADRARWEAALAAIPPEDQTERYPAWRQAAERLNRPQPAAEPH